MDIASTRRKTSSIIANRLGLERIVNSVAEYASTDHDRNSGADNCTDALHHNAKLCSFINDCLLMQRYVHDYASIEQYRMVALVVVVAEVGSKG